MFIKDGELPEDLIEKRKLGTINKKEEKPEPEEEPVYEKPLSEYTAEDWYEKYDKPDIMDRFKVHLIDSFTVYAVFAAIYYFVLPGHSINLTSVVFMYLFFVYLNFGQALTWIELLITNGYTVGKFIYRHRVVRMDGERLTFRDVFVRSFLMKGFCDFASCGIMNMASIIASYVKPFGRAAHDISANTVTIDMKEHIEKEEERVEFK